MQYQRDNYILATPKGVNTLLRYVYGADMQSPEDWHDVVHDAFKDAQALIAEGELNADRAELVEQAAKDFAATRDVDEACAALEEAFRLYS